MIFPRRHRDSHFDAGRKRAVVCSFPPSEVGFGITASASDGSEAVEDEEGLLGRGRK